MWVIYKGMQETLPPSLEKVKAAVHSACLNRPVRRVEVFGSLAQGNTRPGSDVDLLVEFIPGNAVGLFEMGALKEEIEEELGCPVDLVSRKAIEKSTNPYRREAILANPLTLYVR